MPPILTNQTIAARSDELFAAGQLNIYRRIDRLLASLMVMQAIGTVSFAIWVQPAAWVYVATAAIGLSAASLAFARPGHRSTRVLMATAQMLIGALLVYLTRGRIETHFYYFGSLALLAFYRSWRVLAFAAVVAIVSDLVIDSSLWLSAEHSAWLVFETTFLSAACLRSVNEARDAANRTAALEQEVRLRHIAEQDARDSRTCNTAMLNAALDCVIVVDESGRVVQFNPAAERTFGYSASEAVGQDVADLILPEAARAEHRAGLLRHITAGEPSPRNQHLEFTAMRKNGELFPAEVAIAPLMLQDRQLFAGYLRDVSERRRTDTVPVSPLSHGESDFLARMGHDLRAPLNAIILYSELLQQQAQEDGDKQTISDLERIQLAGRYLLEMINGILDLSRIESGRMALTLETFEVRRMVDQMVDTVGSLVEKNGNTLKVHFAHDVNTMTADRAKTKQILLNLLSNAAKFTRNGRIDLTIGRCVVDRREMCEFIVSDTGVGMTAEQVSMVFDPFAQADDRPAMRHGSGAGLGLALASRFSHLMNGQVTVESAPGAGSRFTVRLPQVVEAFALELADAADAA